MAITPDGNHTWLYQLVLQSSPVLTELIGAGQAAVAANTHDVTDAVLNKVRSSFESAFTFPEVRTSCAADDGAALAEYAQQPCILQVQNATNSNVSISLLYGPYRPQPYRPQGIRGGFCRRVFLFVSQLFRELVVPHVYDENKAH